MEHYDLVIIGSGPTGEKAAVKAAYFDKKVAIVEKQSFVGGAGINTGTLPSKTLKQTALYLSGKYEKGQFGVEKKLEKKISIKEFLFRKNEVIASQRKEIEDNLERHKVDLYYGIASFEDEHTVLISGDKKSIITGDYILLATGSYPVHPPEIPFDYLRVHDSDSILEMNRFPRSICIIGAGVIGCEYATIFATMGIPTILINRQKKILPFMDHEISQALFDEMEKSGVKTYFECEIKDIKMPKLESKDIEIKITGGKKEKVDMVLYAAGRSGSIRDLCLEKIGIKIGSRETIVVNDHYQTNIPHVFAVGDVIGFPALASTGMDQARVAVTHMFKTHGASQINRVLPFGVYTIPEVSMVGMTSEEADKAEYEYVSGIADCPSLARGQILGTTYGFLKIIVRKDTGVICGAHMIGPMASEIIHYGMSLIVHKSTVLEVTSHVFNFPTIHDIYKYASYNALGKIGGKVIK